MPWTERGWKEPKRGDVAEWEEFGPSGYPRHRLSALDSGPPVASRTQPIHRPHYSDERFSRGREHTLFGATEEGLSYEYSDRLWQWDYGKARDSRAHAAEHSGFRDNSPGWWEAWLSYYHGKPISLRHIIGGVNVSNGYEYYIFGFKDADQ